MEEDFFDIGIYSIADAARLTNTNQRLIRNWLIGYSQKKRLKGQLPKIDERLAVGFLDLLEIRFISHFRNLGVKMSTLYRAAEKAREHFKSEHPFSKKLTTDGVDIFVKSFTQADDPRLENIVNNQFASYETLKSLINEDVEFDHKGMAIRWFPVHKKHDIVIDPKRSFGKPILIKYGIPTETLHEAFKVEKNAAIVADWYGIETNDVNSAVKFEEGLAA